MRSVPQPLSAKLSAIGVGEHAKVTACSGERVWGRSPDGVLVSRDGGTDFLHWKRDPPRSEGDDHDNDNDNDNRARRLRPFM